MVNFEHKLRHFIPDSLEEGTFTGIVLTVDELEAMRLSFLENLSQTEGATRMDVHQSTFQRTLKRALEKVTEAFVYGKSVKIEGGSYRMTGGDGSDPDGKGLALEETAKMGVNAGAEEELAVREGCACALNAGTKYHTGQEYYIEMKCEKCGAPMVRK